MPEFTAANLPLLLALLVPGFVWWKVHQYFQITRVEAKQSWLGVFSLSAINYAAWSWWIPRLWTSTAASMNALLVRNKSWALPSSQSSILRFRCRLLGG